MNEVLPKPEKLNGTRSCELAALLVTMGFTPADQQMSIATGQGVPGGSLGYWRFLPDHPARRYSLRAVIGCGLDPYQASRSTKYPSSPIGYAEAGEVRGTKGEVYPEQASRSTKYELRSTKCEVYPEQAYIAAAFHNYRLLVESVQHGTRLRLVPCGFLFVFERIEAAAAPEMPGADELRAWRANGTRNTELAAALATLGFNPGDPPPPTGYGVAGAGTRIAHEVRGHVWLFPERSMDGRWSLQERMARWADDAWCAQEGNTDPIAAMADAFWNLRHLRRSLRDARVYVQAQNGQRTVLVRRDASAETWAKAEAFLVRK